MNIKNWFSIKENAYGYLTAVIAVLGVLLAVKLGNYLYPTNIKAIFWMVLPPVFMAFTLVGETKAKQLFFALEHTFYTLIVISLTTFILATVDHYLLIYIGLLVFACIALPRFRHGTMTTSIFLVVYLAICLMVHGMNFYSATDYQPYLHQTLISYLLGAAIVMSLILLLPCVSIPPAPITTDNYQLVRAVRLSIAIVVALTLAQAFHVYNAAWICFAVIVIAQNSLGDSMSKAVERLIGTALGVAAGLLFAHYIAFAMNWFSFSALLFLFLAILLSKRNYTLSLFFLTLLLAATFYLFKRGNIDIQHYLIARLIDTFIGLVIGILCEAVILPRTYITHLRNNLCLSYRDIWSLMIVVKSSYQQADVDELILDMKQRLEQVKIYMVSIRYEPLVLMMRRYKYFKKLPDRLVELEKVLEETLQSGALAQETIIWVQSVFNILRNVYINEESITKKALHAEAERLIELFRKVPSQDQRLLAVVRSVMAIYLRMYSVKKWRLSLR